MSDLQKGDLVLWYKKSEVEYEYEDADDEYLSSLSFARYDFGIVYELREDIFYVYWFREGEVSTWGLSESENFSLLKRQEDKRQLLKNKRQVDRTRSAC